MMFSRKKLFGILGGSVLALAVSFSLAAEVDAATIYVGKNGTAGTTRAQATDPATPFRSIQSAVNSSQPYDVIEVAPGTTADPYYTGAVTITGKNNLTIKGKPGAAKPIIRATKAQTYNYSIIRIVGCSYITFTGFDVDGALVVNSQGGIVNGQEGAGADCNAILILPLTAGSTITTSHHININYNKVHDIGGGGIITNPDNVDAATVGCDYIGITGNEIYKTNSIGKWRSSAISLLQNSEYDELGGFHNVIQNNRVYDNVNVRREPDGSIDTFRHSDGNGIIIDLAGREGPTTLIQNNLVYRNGGRGIHVFESSNVTVLNNTVAQNNLDPYLTLEREAEPGSGQRGGELTVVSASNVLFSNNIVQGNGKAPAFLASRVQGSTSIYYNSNIRFRNNTYTGTYAIRNDGGVVQEETTNALDWNTTIYHEPAWGNLFYNLAGGDFRLNLLPTRPSLTALQSQTARNRGSSAAGELASNDILGVVRKPAGGTPPGGAVDRGAYEQ